MDVFQDLLNIVPSAERIADKDIIEFFIEIQFVRIHCMEFQMWKSFFGRLDDLRVRIDPDTVGRLNRSQKVAAFTADVQDSAVWANYEFINPVQPLIIIRIMFSPAQELLWVRGLVHLLSDISLRGLRSLTRRLVHKLKTSNVLRCFRYRDFQ